MNDCYYVSDALFFAVVDNLSIEMSWIFCSRLIRDNTRTQLSPPRPVN